MRLYAVYERSATQKRRKLPRHADEAYVLVKEGFSWPALFFGPLWALGNGMWVVGALLIAMFIGIGVLPGVLADGQDLATLLACALAILLGLFGNDLRAWSLARSGYELSAVVSGSDLVDAERRLFASLGTLMYGA